MRASPRPRSPKCVDGSRGVGGTRQALALIKKMVEGMSVGSLSVSTLYKLAQVSRYGQKHREGLAARVSVVKDGKERGSS